MQINKFILLGIVILAAVLRLAFLDRLPVGFIPEEVSTGWNAYSLLHTGRDEWGKLLPIVFRETGGYKLALNSYLIVPVMAIFGPTEFAVRFPAAFAGVMSVFLTYLVSIQIFKRRRIALASALLLALTPWHISMGRYAVDVNLGIPLFLGAILFFLKAQKNPKFLIISALFFGLTFYTYFNFVVFSVLFVIGLCIFNYRWILTKKNARFSIVFILILLVSLLPYVITPTLFVRFSQATSVDSIGFTNRINEHRGACQATYSPVLCKLAYNKYVDKAFETSKNWINHFSTTTLFVNGSSLGLSGMPQGWGYLHLYEFALILLGITLFMRYLSAVPLLILWMLLFGVPGSLASGGHIWRMMTLLPLPQLIGGVGIQNQLLKKNRILSWILIGVVTFSVFRFWVDYTSYFPYTQAANSYTGFREVYSYLKNIEKDYDYIVVAPTALNFKQLYIYYLFYGKPDPRKYQKGIEVVREVEDEGWVNVKQVGKWHFNTDVRNIASSMPARALVVTDGRYKDEEVIKVNDEVVLKPLLLHTVYYPSGDPAFKIFEYQTI